MGGVRNTLVAHLPVLQLYVAQPVLHIARQKIVFNPRKGEIHEVRL